MIGPEHKISAQLPASQLSGEKKRRTLNNVNNKLIACTTFKQNGHVKVYQDMKEG